METKPIIKTKLDKTDIITGAKESDSEYDYLIKEIHDLQTRIYELTAQRDDLLYRICPALRAEYETKIGSLERELLAAQLYLGELQRTLEFLQAQINRREAPDVTAAKEKAHEEFRQYQDDLNRKAREAEAFDDFWKHETKWSEYGRGDKDTETSGTGEPDTDGADSRTQDGGGSTDSTGSADRVKNPAAELKKLYKKIVKRLHPDVHPNPSEREKELLNRAIHAYKAGDLGEMRRVWDELIGMEPPEEQFDDTADGISRLKEMLEKLRKICADLEIEIQKIRSEFPYTMKQLLDDEEAVKQKQELLNAQITAAREMLQALTAAIQEIKEKLA